MSAKRTQKKIKNFCATALFFQEKARNDTVRLEGGDIPLWGEENIGDFRCGL